MSKNSSAKHSFTLWLSRILVVILTVLILFVLFNSYLSTLPVCRISGPKHWTADGFRNFAIRTTWNGNCVKHEPVKISLSPSADGGMIIKILAPFFNSPGRPNGPAGQPFPGLWDYEVVEAFFLNDKNQYLEVELGPWGQHLLLILNGERHAVKDKLPLTTYTATIDGDRWTGEAILPRGYFPPAVTKFNAYAIHGEGDNRVYESLYPATGSETKPDFHNLRYFQPIDISALLNNYNPSDVSDLWKPYVNPDSVVG
ncbi:UPF0462 protein C4orf33 homolog isoform X1 [Biomphalaria glabrata]|uniref:UPF0462 protein C4orf33 homolog isoform X1 n=1 Tax=Biomphalaria glabrata TaxID=6526 RepID=A0A9U8EL77_BIOGL|nr:UPF0462 protein C4orf33 homolog isoform X1 [Biomphalaria glabrata]XP_013092917.2 UPF0462 protein C4orf33 homolog isoform X1 [Biomphalaria glabrata]